MTLPDQRVFPLLRDDFVLGWSDIATADYCGTSHGYTRRQTAVGTTNGAGGRNVQIFVLAPDGVVLHALPGFWHPEDFAEELRFAQQVAALWSDPDRTRADKERMFGALHAVALRRCDEHTTARSDWQGFDRNRELARAAGMTPKDAREVLRSIAKKARALVDTAA